MVFRQFMGCYLVTLTIAFEWIFPSDLMGLNGIPSGNLT